jgi:hypothetical protein
MFSRMGAVVSLPTTFRRGDLLWDAPEQTPVCRAPYRRGTKKMYYCVPLRTVPGFFRQIPPMPIRPHLDGQKFDSETIRVMGLAFEMALVALRLADRGDLANDVLARKIMDLAKAGERDPERLCEGVLHEFRGPPPQV